MTPCDLYNEALRRGLRLEPRGDKLAVIPGDRCPPEFAATLRQHKVELLAWLSRSPLPGWQAVPPAGLPLNPLRPAPQRTDARRVMEYIERQIDDALGPLCEWCLRRELEYWTAYHWPDAVCAYAATRDAVCWQLRRTEAEVWTLLEGTKEVASLPKTRPKKQDTTGSSGTPSR
jgi:hypothetical protein